MNILLLYNEHQTYTNTVYEHASSFARFSSHRYFFCHHDGSDDLNVNLDRFDAVVVHYCVRLPYNQISESAATRLSAYRGLKALFIQDEYDHTHRTWGWIKRLGFQLVFTVVPEGNVDRIYPPAEFPNVRFVSNLTGYVSEDLLHLPELVPPSARNLLIGYRGRPLPVRYGSLGQEKVAIAKMVTAYCEKHQLPHDIAWTEERRIYGPSWYDFVESCRAMLGSESGANVFDWDGSLADQVAEYRKSHPEAPEASVYSNVIAHKEMPGLMNQVSPRIFEAIAMRTVLVLFEGSYSGVVEADRHFIPLRKDGSNLDEVFRKLADAAYVDGLAEQAHKDIIRSGRFGYPQFVKMVDGEMEARRALLSSQGLERSADADCHGRTVGDVVRPSMFSTAPRRAPAPCPPSILVLRPLPVRVAGRIWGFVPEGVKPVLRPFVNGIARPLWRRLRRRG